MSNHITARAVRLVIAAVIAMSFGAAAVCVVATAAIPAVASATASPAHALPAQAVPHGGPDNTQWG